MIKKKIIALILAGGQGSRLKLLTQNVAKPAVAFGGKYRIIDFTLSNCINSGIDTVGVLYSERADAIIASEPTYTISNFNDLLIILAE